MYNLKEKNYKTTQELQKRDKSKRYIQEKKKNSLRIRPQKSSNAITASMNAAVDKSTYSHHQECASLQHCGLGMYAHWATKARSDIYINSKNELLKPDKE